MNYRIEKAISGLKRAAEEFDKTDEIQISSEKIVINLNDKEFFGTLFYVLLLIIIPIGLIIYYCFNDIDQGFLLLLLTIWFVYDLNKIVRGENILTIDFQGLCFEVENINPFLKVFFPKRKIFFSEFVKVSMVKVSTSQRMVNEWDQLTVYDSESKKTVFLSFDRKRPYSLIGNRVKLIIDLILKEQKYE